MHRDERCGVYAIVNTSNGKQYIGSSDLVRQRWSLHRRQLLSGKHHSIVLQRAWDKYGEAAFEFVVLAETTKDLLLPLEQHFLNRYQPEYNIAPIAGSNAGIKRSPEYIAAMKRRVNLICVFCTKEFEVQKSRANRILCCSMDCSRAYRKKMAPQRIEQLSNAGSLGAKVRWGH